MTVLWFWLKVAGRKHSCLIYLREFFFLKEFFHSRTNKYDRIFVLIQKVKFSHSSKGSKSDFFFKLQKGGSKHDKSLNKVNFYGKVNISIWTESK